jgi:hypothetical protein
MTNAFGAEQQRIHQVAVHIGTNVQRFAAVEQEWNVDAGIPAPLLELEKLLEEILKWSSLVTELKEPELLDVAFGSL